MAASKMSRRIAIAGASGFVGQALVQSLVGTGVQVAAIARSALAVRLFSIADCYRVSDYSTDAQLGEALREADVAVYLAGRAHVHEASTVGSLALFREANCRSAVGFAEVAASAGVQRLIYLSTIGVNGSETWGEPFRARDLPRPDTPYAVSKMEAEHSLTATARSSGMDLVIIRPPLIYGPGAPGNFGRLLRLVLSETPLPLASVRNSRSFIGIDNLTDLIKRCCWHSGAPGRTLLAADREVISTPSLVRLLAEFSGRRATLFRFSPRILKATAAALGAKRLATQLCGSLEVDIEETCAALEWAPPLPQNEGLWRAVASHGGAQ